MIGFRALMLYILCKRVSSEGCQLNFTDRPLPDDIQEFVHGKGTFMSNCPLLIPNITISSTHQKYLYGAKLSRGACISRTYKKEKVPETYVELENGGSNETILSKGGSWSRFYMKTFSKLVFLPHVEG